MHRCNRWCYTPSPAGYTPSPHRYTICRRVTVVNAAEPVHEPGDRLPHDRPALVPVALGPTHHDRVAAQLQAAEHDPARLAHARLQLRPRRPRSPRPAPRSGRRRAPARRPRSRARWRGSPPAASSRPRWPASGSSSGERGVELGPDLQPPAEHGLDPAAQDGARDRVVGPPPEARVASPGAAAAARGPRTAAARCGAPGSPAPCRRACPAPPPCSGPAARRGSPWSRPAAPARPAWRSSGRGRRTGRRRSARRRRTGPRRSPSPAS